MSAFKNASEDALHAMAQELAEVQQFEANNLIIMCTLLITALSLGRVLHRYHIRSLTESGLYIGIGVGFGAFVHLLILRGTAGREATQQLCVAALHAHGPCVLVCGGQHPCGALGTAHDCRCKGAER